VVGLVIPEETNLLLFQVVQIILGKY